MLSPATDGELTFRVRTLSLKPFILLWPPQQPVSVHPSIQGSCVLDRLDPANDSLTCT